AHTLPSHSRPCSASTSGSTPAARPVTRLCTHTSSSGLRPIASTSIAYCSTISSTRSRSNNSALYTTISPTSPPSPSSTYTVSSNFDPTSPPPPTASTSTPATPCPPCRKFNMLNSTWNSGVRLASRSTFTSSSTRSK